MTVGLRGVPAIGQAAQAAEDYLAATGHRGSVEVTDEEVHVTVSITQPLPVLDAVGIKDLNVSASATAVAEHGVNGPGKSHQPIDGAPRLTHHSE